MAASLDRHARAQRDRLPPEGLKVEQGGFTTLLSE